MATQPIEPAEPAEPETNYQFLFDTVLQRLSQLVEDEVVDADTTFLGNIAAHDKQQMEQLFRQLEWIRTQLLEQPVQDTASLSHLATKHDELQQELSNLQKEHETLTLTQEEMVKVVERARELLSTVTVTLDQNEEDNAAAEAATLPVEFNIIRETIEQLTIRRRQVSQLRQQVEQGVVRENEVQAQVKELERKQRAMQEKMVQAEQRKITMEFVGHMLQMTDMIDTVYDRDMVMYFARLNHETPLVTSASYNSTRWPTIGEMYSQHSAIDLLQESLDVGVVLDKRRSCSLRVLPSNARGRILDTRNTLQFANPADVSSTTTSASWRTVYLYNMVINEDCQEGTLGQLMRRVVRHQTDAKAFVRDVILISPTTTIADADSVSQFLFEGEHSVLHEAFAGQLLPELIHYPATSDPTEQALRKQMRQYRMQRSSPHTSFQWNFVQPSLHDETTAGSIDFEQSFLNDVVSVVQYGLKRLNVHQQTTTLHVVPNPATAPVPPVIKTALGWAVFQSYLDNTVPPPLIIFLPQFSSGIVSQSKCIAKASAIRAVQLRIANPSATVTVATFGLNNSNEESGGIVYPSAQDLFNDLIANPFILVSLEQSDTMRAILLAWLTALPQRYVGSLSNADSRKQQWQSLPQKAPNVGIISDYMQFPGIAWIAWNLRVRKYLLDVKHHVVQEYANVPQKQQLACLSAIDLVSLILVQLPENPPSFFAKEELPVIQHFFSGVSTWLHGKLTNIIEDQEVASLHPLPILQTDWNPSLLEWFEQTKKSGIVQKELVEAKFFQAATMVFNLLHHVSGRSPFCREIMLRCDEILKSKRSVVGTVEEVDIPPLNSDVHTTGVTLNRKVINTSLTLQPTIQVIETHLLSLASLLSMVDSKDIGSEIFAMLGLLAYLLLSIEQQLIVTQQLELWEAMLLIDVFQTTSTLLRGLFIDADIEQDDIPVLPASVLTLTTHATHPPPPHPQ